MLSSLMWYGERYSTPIRSDIANLSESAFACNTWATTITLEEEEEEEEKRTHRCYGQAKLSDSIIGRIRMTY